MTTNRIIASGVATVAAVGFLALRAHAHCQVPCGIYGDGLRFELMEEHVSTMEKAMSRIEALSAAGKNRNQIVRWVNAKEKHADELAEIVTYYFMTQRLKPAPTAKAPKRLEYLNKLELLHRMLVHAMKAKQTTDLSHVSSLRELIVEFRSAYFGESDRGHLERHH
ncbi:superoxide dismutase [Ni] [Elusimicrobiota bacterium]